ncbi:MAG: SUMF1/EgtB/PvdO family nonheme iron enzyme [Phycisphaerales bacterium]|nr:SUMF1/EgtB/PvdO family nonheme iron enzyme [Phycisphaerales bacterium]
MLRYLPLTVSVMIFTAFSTSARGELFSVQLATVPASDEQPGGPIYDYDVGVFEVTNAQFVAFLNDAEFHNEVQNPGFGNERGDNMLWRAPPFNTGDVGLIVGDSGDVDAVFDISRSLITYNPFFNVGTRYDVVAGKEDHAAVGMSWIGAAKFCNWLTIDQGLGLGERCFVEGPGEVDWFPVTTGDDIGGTQQATNLARDLDDGERCALVRNHRGFRFLMDQGGIAVGGTNAVPRPFNEWYKAAAYDPAAPDVPRAVFVGFPFEEHIVPADHWTHAFGRDPLTNADANFRSSGDPFDNPDPAVIATAPVGYYDGTDHGGAFATNPNNNRYGIFDMSGSIWEFLNDQVEITASTAPDRSIAGGSYRSNNMQVTCANRGDVGPGSTRPVIGFRVMRVTNPPVIPGDLNCDCKKDINDFAPFVQALLDSLAGCDAGQADINGDTQVDGLDIQLFIEDLLTP